MKTAKRAMSVLLALLLFVTVVSSCDTTKPEPEKSQINIGIATDVGDSLDPHRMSSAAAREVLFNIFEGLVKPTPDGSLVPAVASDYTINETGDTFTFTLRDNVKFHNGETVTADDVVYSIKRCAGMLPGDEAPLISAFAVVESVEATGDKTVVITTKETNIEFLVYLTAAIIPEGYEEQANAPVGTGPYKFVSRALQESVTFEKFNDYWGEKANIDEVTFKVITNSEAIMMSLRSGAIDFCAHLTASQMRELGDSDYNFEVGNMNIVQAVYLNNAVAPFDNVEVRRALAHAINRQEIMDFLSDGLGTPIGSGVHPAFTKYFLPELADMYEYNPTLAKQMLADAGYPNGFSFTITVPSNYTPHVDTATVVVEQLKEIGVTATIQLVEFETWRSEAYTNRNFEATIIGLEASYMSARALLERYLSTGSKNFINFSDAEYDETLIAALTSTDDAEQTELYKRLETILAEQEASLYLQDLCDVVAVSKKLTGYEFYPMYILDLAKLKFAS